jgi:hypothetical protein
MTQPTTRVKIAYADQNEAFARCLPATGRLERSLTADNDPRLWWVVALDEPLEYQLKVGEPFQYRLITTRELVIGSRVLGQEVGQDQTASVHILLPLNQAATIGDRLRTSDFHHAAWGVCQREDAA